MKISDIFAFLVDWLILSAAPFLAFAFITMSIPETWWPWRFWVIASLILTIYGNHVSSAVKKAKSE
jgi:hypothetical protein